MTEPQALLEAHVAFELARWTGDRLEDSVQDHVTAVRAWLDGILLGDVVPEAEMARAAGMLTADLVLTDELLSVVADVAASGHAALLEHHGPVGDLIAAHEYDALVLLVAGQDAARRQVIEAITASKAYSRLVSHVLYQGLKGYLLTENLLARKVPGASSLVRLGQRGLNTAAPKLEAGMDRRLASFVESSLTETLKESRRYLESTLDDAMFEEMAAEVWGAVVDRPLSTLVALVDPADTQAAVTAFAPVLRRWREAGLLARVAEAVVAGELARHAARPVGDLLAEWGLETASLTAHVVALLRPAVEHARDTGLLEARIRAQLEPFYAALPALLDADQAGGRRTATRKPAATRAAPAKKAPKKAATEKPTAKKAATEKPTARKSSSRQGARTGTPPTGPAAR